MEFDFWLLKRRAFWPGAECLPKFSFHLRRIEIPRDAQNDVVGVNMRMMPVDRSWRVTAATVAYSGTRAYGFCAPYANLVDSRTAIPPTSSLRREMASKASL